jgi:hypothetical protein
MKAQTRRTAFEKRARQFMRAARQIAHAPVQQEGLSVSSMQARPIAGGDSASWSDPDWSILDDRRGDLPEFPTDTLSPRWRDWSERAAHGAGVTPAHVGVPLLGVASSLIGTARRVRASRPWSEPLSLWTCIVGASGDGKTPGISVTVRALDLIEKNNLAAINTARLVHATRVQKAKEANKKWKQDLQAALEAVPPRDPPSMPDDAIDPGTFIAPQLYINDPTIERLADLLQVRPRGMVLIRDELSGLFANMARYSGGNDRPFWLEAWNGRRHVIERKKKSTIVEHLLVGVVGGFQPDRLARAFAGDEDGMSGRFLFAWPSAPEYRPLSNEVSEVEPELMNALTALIKLPAEDADGVFEPQTVSLSDGALAKFEEFRRLAYRTRHELDGLERQSFGKGVTHVLRLAAVLAYLGWAIELGRSSPGGIEGITGGLEPEAIDQQYMVAAIRLWLDYFWPHARAALRQVGLTDRHRKARRVLRWIAWKRLTEVSREEIRREALSQTLDAEGTQTLLEVLVSAGWLRNVSTQTAGRTRRRWQVNPILDRLAQSAQSAESASA